MATIVCLERDSLGDALTLPELTGDHEWRNYSSTTEEQIIARLRDADIAVINKTILTEASLSQLPKLKCIAVTATGVNNVDLDAANRLGIKVCNIQNYASDSVGEHTLMLMLALRRSLMDYRHAQLNGQWQTCGQFYYDDFPIDNLSGQTLGIIGSGHLGQHLAQLVKALGMKVQFSGRKKQSPADDKVAFEQVLATSDVISINCPLTTDTHHLISHDEFALMKPNALLINTARGGIVNEEALLTAIQNQTIAGAGFDVSIEEPPREDSPLMQAANYPNCIVTPHIAWASQQSRQRMLTQLIANIQSFLDGHPEHLVN